MGRIDHDINDMSKRARNLYLDHVELEGLFREAVRELRLSGHRPAAHALEEKYRKKILNNGQTY